MTDEPAFSAADLRQFTGSEQFFRHGLSRKHIYTEGVHYLARRAGCYWLLDKIALHSTPAIDAEDFQVWTLTLKPDRTAVIVTEDGNGTVLKTEDITWTDFPLPEISLWAERNERGGFTIMLPSER
jgi:hypothetical protein